MYVSIELESFAGRGGTRALTRDAWIWPLFFVIDDRSVPAVLSGRPLGDDAVLVGRPVRPRETRASLGRARHQIDRTPLARFGVEPRITSLGEHRARVGLAVILTNGDPRDENITKAVSAFRMRLQSVLAKQVAHAMGLPDLSEALPTLGDPNAFEGFLKAALGQATEVPKPTGPLLDLENKAVHEAIDEVLDPAAAEMLAGVAILGRLIEDPMAADAPAQTDLADARPPARERPVLVNPRLAGVHRVSARLSRPLTSLRNSGALAATIGSARPTRAESSAMHALAAATRFRLDLDRVVDRNETHHVEVIASTLRSWSIAEIEGSKKFKAALQSPRSRRASFSVGGRVGRGDALVGSSSLGLHGSARLHMGRQDDGQVRFFLLSERGDLKAAGEVTRGEKHRADGDPSVLLHGEGAWAAWRSDDTIVVATAKEDSWTWATKPLRLGPAAPTGDPALVPVEKLAAIAWATDEGVAVGLQGRRGFEDLKSPVEHGVDDPGLIFADKSLWLAVADHNGKLGLWRHRERQWKRDRFETQHPSAGRPAFATAAPGRALILCHRTAKGGLALYSRSPNGWGQPLDLVERLGIPSPVSDPSLVLWRDNLVQVAYRGRDGHVHLVARRPEGRWHHTILSRRVRSGPASGIPRIDTRGKALVASWISASGHLVDAVRSPQREWAATLPSTTTATR